MFFNAIISYSLYIFDDSVRAPLIFSPYDIFHTRHDVEGVGDNGHTVHDSPANVSSTAEASRPATVISGGGKFGYQLLRLHSSPQPQLQVLQLQLSHLGKIGLAHVISLGGCLTFIVK